MDYICYGQRELTMWYLQDFSLIYILKAEKAKKKKKFTKILLILFLYQVW